MNKIWNISLRTKIMLLALTVNIVVAAGAFFNLQKMAKSYEEAHLHEFYSKSQMLSMSIANQFYERYGDVQAFAKNESIRLMHTDRMQKDLNEYIATYGVYDLVVVLDKNGKLVASNQTDINKKLVNTIALAQVNFAQTPWFQAALKGEFTENASKSISGTYFGDVALDPVLKEAFGEDRFGATFAAQIKDYDGNLVGIIATKSNTRWYDTTMEEFYRTIENSYPNTELTILNKDGQYVLRYYPASIKDPAKRVVHDPEQILKQKYFTSENEISRALKEQKSGASTQIDQVDGNEDIVGYSFIKHPKWVSTIGWSILFHNEKEEVFANVYQAKTYFYWLSGIISLLGLCFSTWAGLKLSKSVEHISEELAENTKQLDEASVKIASGATQLSESATEQASALQETVSTIDQISSMIQKNSEAAQKSKELSAQSTSSAEQGRQTIDSMLMAISEIETNNTEVSEQMEQTNAQLAEITKMIHNISNKTKVINEIVFQTKLLSFNASVEAARAGEYGKGFAVVAEEVGKLAQMSGGAAKEISSMLEESVGRVEVIIQETRTKVEKLMDQSKEKVNYGSETAKQCKQALDEIAVSVKSVDQLVSEIAVASKEQSAGVVQISQAVNQLESVTNQNSAVAQASSASAEQLRAQAGSMNHLVDELAVYVHGNSSQQHVHESTTVKPTKVSASSEKSKVQANKVLAFESKKNVSNPSYGLSQSQPAFKNASGYDGKIPSADDPGFSEE
ncbi:hypothetical protein K2P97_02245 [bacterium]|nr:hypothetical protein [bacterium]